MEAGKGSHIGRSDFTAAFRNLGVCPRDWPLLIMKARSPLDSQWYYFVDKCLPFGSSISCAMFQAVSDAIAHIMQVKNGKELVNYLDDFLFVALLRWVCNQHLQTFLDVCQEINFPVSKEKTFKATTCLTFLGMLLNTISCMVSVPVDKKSKARNLIQEVLSKKSKKITVNQ